MIRGKITQLIIFFLLCFLGNARAQQLQGKALAPIAGKRNVNEMKTIDEGYLKCLYAFNADDIKASDTYIDLQRLEIGENVSKYYSDFVFNNDSLVWAWRQAHPKARSVPRQIGALGKKPYYWLEYKYSEYFKDTKTNKLTEYARMPHGAKPGYQCSEIIPVQNWEFHKETLAVHGYLCHKATCHFRGRNYVAWYTKEIPVSNGPWKFGGLPGLILKVYDTQRLYTFECVKIEKNKYPIKRYDFESYQLIDRLELLNFQRKLNEDFCRTVGARTRDGRELPPPVAYEPLELK